MIVKGKSINKVNSICGIQQHKGKRKAFMVIALKINKFKGITRPFLLGCCAGGLSSDFNKRCDKFLRIYL